MFYKNKTQETTENGLEKCYSACTLVGCEVYMTVEATCNCEIVEMDKLKVMAMISYAGNGGTTVLLMPLKVGDIRVVVQEIGRNGMRGKRHVIRLISEDPNIELLSSIKTDFGTLPDQCTEKRTVLLKNNNRSPVSILYSFKQDFGGAMCFELAECNGEPAGQVIEIMPGEVVRKDIVVNTPHMGIDYQISKEKYSDIERNNKTNIKLSAANYNLASNDRLGIMSSNVTLSPEEDLQDQYTYTNSGPKMLTIQAELSFVLKTFERYRRVVSVARVALGVRVVRARLQIKRACAEQTYPPNEPRFVGVFNASDIDLLVRMKVEPEQEFRVSDKFKTLPPNSHSEIEVTYIPLQDYVPSTGTGVFYLQIMPFGQIYRVPLTRSGSLSQSMMQSSAESVCSRSVSPNVCGEPF
ncbi:hypothetical protein AAG570_004850 [Ranatra chinensis]|uniref:Uncharacterized protein n=1 Tax=Ranatra chinensis TaxID=642074 RepID=A0ABD0YMB6_9HEMI